MSEKDWRISRRHMVWLPPDGDAPFDEIREYDDQAGSRFICEVPPADAERILAGQAALAREARLVAALEEALETEGHGWDCILSSGRATASDDCNCWAGRARETLATARSAPAARAGGEEDQG